MTAREAAEAGEADKAQKQRKIQKEKEIKQRYDAELAELHAEDPDSLTARSMRQVSPTTFALGSQQGGPIHLPSSPSPTVNSDCSLLATSLSPKSETPDLPRQSGRVRKPI